jgi:hypothetical protein
MTAQFPSLPSSSAASLLPSDAFCAQGSPIRGFGDQPRVADCRQWTHHHPNPATLCAPDN